MKRLLTTIYSLALVPALVSCGLEGPKEETPQEQRMVPVSIEAGFPQTKVTLDNLTPVWSEGDKVAFFTGDDILCPAFDAGEAGSSHTTFSGLKPEGSHLKTAIYPYSASLSCSRKGYNITLPFKQNGAFNNAVMVGTGSEQDGFSFMNVCCVVKVNVPEALDAVKVEVLRDDQVSGLFYLTTSSDGQSFQIETRESLSSQDKRAAAVNIQGLSGLQYIPVLPSASKKITLAVTNADGKVAFPYSNKTFLSGNAYLSGKIKNLGTLKTNLTFTDVATIDDSTNGQL